MACPGADTCAIAVTSSRGLAVAIGERMHEIDDRDPLVSEVRIKISGCPNSCGHHNIADIGFHGASVHVGDKMIPASQLLIGGYVGKGEASMAKPVMKIAARRTPDAVVHLLDTYKRERNEGEPFRAWTARIGVKGVKEVLTDFQDMPRFEDDPTQYVDWAATRLFDLSERGEGECAV
jgi:ferredoxin-nitrite reductase/sulfite reductase (ferredoxin)